jgi:hypothetical protein
LAVGFHATDRTDLECPPSSVECNVKFLSEYTRTVLSEVAVAMRGRPLGFGIETQAREEAVGLKSAMGIIRVWVLGMGVGVAMVCCLEGEN